MKKLTLIFVSFLFVSFVFAQSAEPSILTDVNRKIAERCLRAAENHLLSQDYNGALSQSVMGLSYDDSVSDLLYVKAMAQAKLGSSRAEILSSIQEAFAKDTWIDYNKNGARILYADLLCDTGLYEESLSVLNDDGFIYSADAEFIRIKNLYRMATAPSIEQARQKIDSNRRIYSSDDRFPKIFFAFEYAFLSNSLINGVDYYVPDVVKNIASSYIKNFPDYNTADTEIELLSSFFTEGETRKRLLKAVEAKNPKHPLFPIAALSAKTISEQKAHDLFVNTLDGEVSLSELSSLILLLTDTVLIDDIAQRLTSFEGTLYIDENLDLQNELVVKYERGRPVYINYDANMDGEKDLYSVCDFGVPLFASFSQGQTEVFYESYPEVNCVNLNKDNAVYYFLSNDYIFTPFDMIVLPVFDRIQTSFYIPFVNPELEEPTAKILLQKTSCIELTAQENGLSKVVYTYFDSKPVFASFTDSLGKFAYCSMEAGCPFVRYVDFDRDGIFETSETYDIDTQNDYASKEERALIKKIFGSIPFAQNLYLKRIEIDRNNDTVVEYKEEFLGGGNKTSSWDDDGNGIWDSEYFRFVTDESLIEESVFYDTNGLKKVKLICENGIPQKIQVDSEIVAVVPGRQEKFYWLGTAGTMADENDIYKDSGLKMEEGKVCVIQGTEKRFSVIKIDGKFFCRTLPQTYIQEEEEE